MNKKEIGEYYTPHELVENMVNQVFHKLNGASVLEPSAGDGRFVDLLAKANCNKMDVIELFKDKCDLIEAQVKNKKINIICSDYIDFAVENDRKYDVIIGNPPYIKKTGLTKLQREKSLQLLDEEVTVRIENIWVSFLLGAVKQVKKDGIIYFVLPFEFLQTKYSEELRCFLEKKFNKIEITVFEEKVFPEIEQDVCLLYLTNDDSFVGEYIKYIVVKNMNDINSVVYESQIMKNKPLKKWTNAVISDEEMELLNVMSNRMQTIDRVGNISPGIVTGANDFFIKDPEFVRITNATSLPIVSKSQMIGNLLMFKEQDFDQLINENKQVLLLDLHGEEKYFSETLQEYLKLGVSKNINSRFKCSNRTPWYRVPIIDKGDLLFFKRYHILPKLVINECDVFTTDISYNIRLNNDNYSKYSIAFCFYNSLTITMCEYLGRFYGGGVCELTPSEFKKLPLPYKNISKEKLNKLDKMLRNTSDSEKIIDYVDSIVLNEFMTEEEIAKIRSIRRKLIGRRIKETMI